MANWETRERTTKRAALVVSVLLHIAVFAALASMGGEKPGLFDKIFKSEPTESVAEQS